MRIDHLSTARAHLFLPCLAFARKDFVQILAELATQATKAKTPLAEACLSPINEIGRIVSRCRWINDLVIQVIISNIENLIFDFHDIFNCPAIPFYGYYHCCFVVIYRDYVESSFKYTTQIGSIITSRKTGG